MAIDLEEAKALHDAIGHKQWTELAAKLSTLSGEEARQRCNDILEASLRFNKYAEENWDDILSELARLREQMRWVAIAERQPPKNDFYPIVYLDHKGEQWEGVAYFWTDKWVKTNEQIFPNVTHWRAKIEVPLPQPPDSPATGEG